MFYIINDHTHTLMLMINYNLCCIKTYLSVKSNLSYTCIDVCVKTNIITCTLCLFLYTSFDRVVINYSIC